MNDQVSFGSQPQYRPHADSAQIAPQITPNVQIGNPTACTRNVNRSRASAAGRRRPIGYGKRVLPASYPLRIRCLVAPTKPTRKMPVAMAMAVTWIFSQYESRAGTSGATLV